MASVLADVSILAGQLAPSSIARYRGDVAAYLRWCVNTGVPPAQASSLARWRTVPAQETTYSPHTIIGCWPPSNGWSRKGAAQGVPDLDADTAGQFAGVGGVKVSALRERQRAHGRTRISPTEMRRLCEAPDPPTLRGLRDRALLAVLASSGVRISEACGLLVGNVYARDGGHFVRVLGKGQAVTREAPLSLEAYQAVHGWLTARPVLSAFVFTGWAGRGAGRASAAPLTSAGAWQIVTGYAQALWVRTRQAA